jgi:hypothetical protein
MADSSAGDQLLLSFLLWTAVIGGLALAAVVVAYVLLT